MIRMSKCHIQVGLRRYDLRTGRCGKVKCSTEREENRSIL